MKTKNLGILKAKKSVPISKDELLSQEEELELIKRAQNGDQFAMEQLINANRRFVRAIAKRYEGKTLSLDDLIIEGNKGLEMACIKFDKSRGFKFISFAIWFIRQSIKNALKESTNNQFLTPKERIIMKSHSAYKKDVLQRLIKASGKTWNGDGVWRGIPRKHILPLESTNTRVSRAKAIKKYLNFDCHECLPKLKGLHQYAHHLNSSQLLCMIFFSRMIEEEKATDKMVQFINSAFGISIKEGAECKFEYTENHDPYIFNILDKKEYEGTSFDFHISDGTTEISFEIKLTEYGFGKATMDNRHEQKAEQYIKLLPAKYSAISTEEMLQDYQIFRNITRAKNKNAYVIFITDGNNIQTNNEIKKFTEKYGTLPSNVKFTTWQKITPSYPCELPFQLKAIL